MRAMVRFYVLLVIALLTLGANAAASDEQGPYDTSRILSVGGDVTEVLYALDVGDKIVAVDTTSLFPPDVLKTKKNVGYMRALSAEGVLSVGPTLILASEGAGPPETVRALKASSVTYVVIPNDPSPDGIVAKVSAIASAVDKKPEGDALAARVERAFAGLSTRRKKIKKRRKVLFVLNASAGRMIVGGSGTSADAAITLAGGENAAKGIEGFKPITEEALIAMAPDAVLIMKGGRGGHDASKLKDRPAMKATPGGASNRIKDVDGLYLLGFGPRMPDAARDVMTWLYPELDEEQ